MELTPKDLRFIEMYPALERDYLRSRGKGTSETLAEMFTLRQATSMKMKDGVKDGEMISSKEYAQERKKGFKEEKVRRKKAKQGENFIDYLSKTNRNDIISELKE